MKKQILTILFFLVLSNFVSAQERDTSDVFYIGEINAQDSTIVFELDDIEVRARYGYKYRHKMRQYNRLARKVKKVYPYALILEERLQKIEEGLSQYTTEAQKKKFIKQEERLLFNEFEEEITKLRISEGIILVKLIDRQTGDTSYELIKDLRGSITAFFWQGVARFFGNDLKAEYDSEEADKMIEDIVLKIENGEL